MRNKNKKEYQWYQNKQNKKFQFQKQINKSSQSKKLLK